MSQRHRVAQYQSVILSPSATQSTNRCGRVYARSEDLSPSHGAIRAAREYLGGAAELIILDSSHEYRSTLVELDLWYAALPAGGLLVIIDESRFAQNFDVKGGGGVHRAFDEWRVVNPLAETFLLNGEARSMDQPRPLYKDTCGLGLIHKPGV